MNFSFTEEQDALRAEARRFLADRVDVRAQIAQPGAHDADLWKAMAGLGWTGAAVAEKHGGQGFSGVDLCVLIEETGRALLPGPLLSHLIASLAIVHAGSDEQRAALLPSIANGETVAVCTEHISGPVGCGAVADLVAVFEFGAPSVLESFDAEPVETVDLTRPGARISPKADPTRLGKPTPLRMFASLAVAAESVGTAAAALDMAVAYAKERHQFERPIGSFQAIKHKAADMLRALEAARLQVYYAASLIDANDAAGDSAVAMAKAAANDALIRCAAENIQIHGGIGVTWEHDAHLYYRRALASAASFGDTAGARDFVARALLEELDA